MSVRLVSLLPRGLHSARTWVALGVVAAFRPIAAAFTPHFPADA